MTRRTTIILAIVLTAITTICLLCLLGSSQLLYRQCLFFNCAPERSFTIFDLDLPDNLFPVGAATTPLHSTSEKSGALESVNKTVYWKGGSSIASYNIWRFGTQRRSEQFYQGLKNLDHYTKHPDINYISPIANQYFIGCGVSEFGFYGCEAIAQYEEYVISFHSVIDEDMSFRQFGSIAAFIDRIITTNLDVAGNPSEEH